MHKGAALRRRAARVQRRLELALGRRDGALQVLHPSAQRRVLALERGEDRRVLAALLLLHDVRGRGVHHGQFRLKEHALTQLFQLRVDKRFREHPNELGAVKPPPALHAVGIGRGGEGVPLGAALARRVLARGAVGELRGRPGLGADGADGHAVAACGWGPI